MDGWKRKKLLRDWLKKKPFAIWKKNGWKTGSLNDRSRELTDCGIFVMKFMQLWSNRGISRAIANILIDRRKQPFSWEVVHQEVKHWGTRRVCCWLAKYVLSSEWLTCRETPPVDEIRRDSFEQWVNQEVHVLGSMSRISICDKPSEFWKRIGMEQCAYSGAYEMPLDDSNRDVQVIDYGMVPLSANPGKKFIIKDIKNHEQAHVMDIRFEYILLVLVITNFKIYDIIITTLIVHSCLSYVDGHHHGGYYALIRIMLRLKVCMIVSMLQGSIWINTYLNLRMKSPRDLDSIFRNHEPNRVLYYTMYEVRGIDSTGYQKALSRKLPVIRCMLRPSLCRVGLVVALSPFLDEVGGFAWFQFFPHEIQALLGSHWSALLSPTPRISLFGRSAPFGTPEKCFFTSLGPLPLMTRGTHFLVTRGTHFYPDFPKSTRGGLLLSGPLRKRHTTLANITSGRPTYPIRICFVRIVE
uniref:Uncharacterized protein n=1 Tax=Vitis vinifera TaxID=29760 RepID=A5BEL0_VITVI|nr:hypothetical protein VITISV_031598 [Vitis vinifera]